MDDLAVASGEAEMLAVLRRLAAAVVPRRATSPPPAEGEFDGSRDARRTEHRFRTLVEQIPAVVFLAALGEGENEVYVSPQIETLLGFSQREWLENPLLWYSQLHPDDRGTVIDAFTRGVQTGKPFRAEVRFFTRDGRVVWIQGEARLVHDTSGRPDYFQGVAFDVTGSKEAQALLSEAEQTRTEAASLRADELAEANERLQELNEQLQDATIRAEEAAAARETFLATMSHELRTPLNSVIVLACLLADTVLSPSQLDMMRSLQLSAGYLFDLINDVLDFSRLRANRVELVPRLFDVQQWLEDTLEIMAPRVAEKSLGFRYVLHPEVPLQLKADDSRLRQVLVNLLANAVKFTDSGEVVVALRSEPAPGGLTRFACSVRDTGIGIAPDRLGVVFDEFRQADSGIAREFGGSGLGLAICRSLVDLMGGDLTVDSRPGEGSEFTFIWVCRACGEPGRPPPDPILAGRSCLILDDRPGDAHLFADLVRSLGMSPSVTTIADEALAWVRAGQRFDLAVVGHNVQGPARSLVEGLIAAHAPAPLPVIVSASVTAGPALRAENLPCAGLLPKPLRQSVLGRALATVVRTGRLPSVELSPKPCCPVLPPGLRILVVDDHAMNRHAADLLLRSLGFEAELVASGPEAIDVVTQREFDLVLMDLAMPGVDGITAAREIRRLGPAIRQPQIVALTATTAPGGRAACLEAGMEGVLTKPIDRGELIQALTQAGAARSAGQPVGLAAPDERPSDAVDHDASVLRDVAAQFSSGAARQFVDMFRGGPSGAPNEIAAAMADGRVDDAHRLAHTLKSSADLVGATALARRSADLEAHLEQGNLPAAWAAAATLPKLMARVLDWLEASPYG